MGKDLDTAYLRDFHQSGQCELSFTLITKLKDLGAIEEEINAVRQITDTVESLIGHIQNKLRKLIKDKFFTDEESQENQPLFDVPVSLKRGEKHIKSSMRLENLPDSLKNSSEPIVFQVFDHKYQLTHNIPVVRFIKLPEVLYANFPVQPVKVNALFVDHQKSSFKWYRSLDKVVWKEVGNKYQYLIEQEDEGHYLKFVCNPVSATNLIGPTYEVVTECKVDILNELPRCPFEKRHEYTKGTLKDNEIRIVTYNVLAERYAILDDNFTYVNPKHLAIDYRKQLILKELLGYNADLVCLQEVDNRQYAIYFRDKMKENGFIGIYNKKGDVIPEGLAFFFKKSRFVKLESQHIVYGNALQHLKIFSSLLKLLNKNQTFKQDFVRKSTSLQVTVLKNKQTKKFLIVANTHLYYHPDADAVRLLQAYMATTYLSSLKRRYDRNTGGCVVLFCGDFNSSYTKSLFPFMIKGRMNPNHEDCLKIDENGHADIFHEFIFTSAYGTPKYTNYTPDYKGCLDYIFVERTKMDIIRVIPLIADKELEKYEGLPNEVFPSDHLALVADLRWK